MLGLDVIGVSWGDVGDVGKAAFPYIHATGKGVASAFGAGAAADALEHVEQGQGWLPATPAPATAPITSTVQKVATQKAHPGDKPTPKPGDTKPPKAAPSTTQPQAHYSAVKIIGGVGLVGVIVLVLRRLLRAA